MSVWLFFFLQPLLTNMSYTSLSLTTLLLPIILTVVVVNATTFDYSSQSEVLKTATGRIRGARVRNERDFVLGGLFPIHAAVEGGGACGEVRLERGLERMEAMLFAIDTINSDSTLLPNLTLGFDIRDTCNSENIGLDETVDLVITSSQLDIQSCQSGMDVTGQNETDFFMDAPTSGIVGAASSRVSVPIASLVRLFTTPQVSYASSSAILSNRDRYEFFYRTIPPDNLQARAMIDVMLRFNWTYVSNIYSRNPYGEPGITEFQNLARENGICIDLDEGIEDNFTPEQFAGLAEKLKNSEANVVILFTSQDNAEQLLGYIANSTEVARRFIWVASDAWARSINVVRQFNDTAAGLVGFAPLTEHLEHFEDYFSQLTIENNMRNPWFAEFYEAIAKCDLNGTENPCSRNASVTELPQYEQGNFIPLVVDAVYTYAHALQDFLDDNCQQPLQWFRNNRTCLNQARPLDGTALLEYIQAAEFNSPSGNQVLFDTEGNVEGRYEIVNYQAEGEGNERVYFFQQVGTWDSSVVNDSDLQALSLNQSVQFGLREGSEAILLDPPVSQCGRCGPGQYRRLIQSSCCGICEPCLGANYSNDPQAMSCMQCANEYWGNDPLVGSDRCVGLQESFLSFNHVYSIIIMIVALIGLCLVVFTVVVMGIYWTTPVVKSSGREQMILLLLGITISFVAAFFYVSPPSPEICGIQRWLFWTAFSLMFGALLVKIVRVARIFLRKASLSRPRFTEPQYQVLFTCIIVFIQWIIVAIGFAIQNPEVGREVRLVADMPLQFPTIIVTCVVDTLVFLILSIGYESVLIIACTILGVLSFSYPENFNEAKYIAFCSLSTLVIWIAFVITYVATEDTQEFQNIAISLAVVMTGYAVLFCLFAPKLFIILFRPKENVSKISKHGTSDFNSAGAVGSVLEKGRSSISFTMEKSTGKAILVCIVAVLGSVGQYECGKKLV